MSSQKKFEDELFGDLNLKPSDFQAPEPPALTQVPGFDTLNVANLSMLEERQKQNTSAIKSPLKKPPPRGPNMVMVVGGVIALVLLGGIGVMYGMGLGPFAPKSAMIGTKRVSPRLKKGRQLLHIATKPQGAEVWINGKPYPSKTPVDLVLMSHRTYKFAIKLSGYEDVLKSLVVQVAQKPLRYDIVLKKKSNTPEPPRLRPPDLNDLKHGEGYVQVICDPIGATVVMGKRPAIKCPATIQIEGGTHPLVVEKEGYESYSGGVTVFPAQVISLPIKLTPLSPEMLRKLQMSKKTDDQKGAPGRRVVRRGPRGKGGVTITSQLPAIVFWRGKKMGTTPVTFQLPAGRQTLVLKGKNGAQRSIEVVVKAKKTVSNRVTFGFGRIRFNVKPWADVWINGKKIGQTPIPPYKVREGVYAVVLRNGTKSHRQRVVVEGNETAYVFYYFQ